MFFLSVFLPVFFSCYCFCASCFPFRSSPAFLTGALLSFSVLLGSLIQPAQSVTFFLLSLLLSFTTVCSRSVELYRLVALLFVKLYILLLSFSYCTSFAFDDSLFSKRRTFTVSFFYYLSNYLVLLSFSHCIFLPLTTVCSRSVELSQSRSSTICQTT